MSIWEKIQFKYVCYRTLLWKHKSHIGLLFVIKRLVGLRYASDMKIVIFTYTYVSVSKETYVYVKMC